MTLKDEMTEVTTKAKKSKFEKEQEKIRQKATENREWGEERAKEIIAKLPARIKKAAKNGENHIYESTTSGWGPGRYMLHCIESWADDNGFDIRFEWNNEPANEGGDEYDSITISW